MTDGDRRGEWWEMDHRAHSDAAFFSDFATWSAFRLVKSSREILDAFEESDSREERKDLAARIALNHREAIETYGALCHGFRNRGEGPVIRAVLGARVSDSRTLYQKIRREPNSTFAAFFRLEGSISGAIEHPLRDQMDFETFCEMRRNGLLEIATTAAQSMLFQFYTPGLNRYLLVSSGNTVSAIKTGTTSEMRGESNSGFFLVDVTPVGPDSEPDLLAIAAPAVPGILRAAVDEIDFMAQEASLIAGLMTELATAGQLYGNAGGNRD